MTPYDLRALADALATTGRPGGICQQAADYLRQQAEQKPLSAVDADYWARHRPAILDAIERAGFVLMSDANRFWLHPAPAAPQAEPKRKMNAIEREPCPNALTPDGPVCPRCGGKRGPSGVDGGSWVHMTSGVSKREPTYTAEVSLAAGHGYWGVALCVGAQSFALSAEFATLTEADEYAERLRKALGITGDSDAD